MRVNLTESKWTFDVRENIPNGVFEGLESV